MKPESVRRYLRACLKKGGPGRLPPNEFFRRVLMLLPAAVIMAQVAAGPAAGAQTISTSSRRPGIPSLSATLADGEVTLSWPTTAARWNLFEQQGGIRGEWKPVAETLYRTNNLTISARITPGAEARRFRLKRSLVSVKPPAAPGISTDRPRPTRPASAPAQ